jgi:hypothetical protein
LTQKKPNRRSSLSESQYRQQTNRTLDATLETNRVIRAAEGVSPQTRVILHIALLSVLVYSLFPFDAHLGMFQVDFARAGVFVVCILWFIIDSVPDTINSFSRQEKGLALLVLSLSASILWSWDRLATLRSLVDIFFYVSFAFVISRQIKLWTAEKDYLQIISTYCLMLTGAGSFVMLILPQFGFRFSAAPNVRLFHPNYAARALILGLPFAFERLDTGKIVGRMMAGLLVFIAVLSVLNTGLRAAFITLFVASVVYALFAGVSLKRFLLVAGAVLLAFVLLRSPVVRDPAQRIVERLLKVDWQQAVALQHAANAKIGHSRMIMYRTALNLLSTNWGFGIGYGAFRSYCSLEGMPIHGHLLKVWVGAGIVPAGMLVWLMLSTLRHARKVAVQLEPGRRTKLAALSAGFAGLLVHGMLQPMLEFSVTYLSIGLLIGCIWKESAKHSSIKQNLQNDRAAGPGK